MLFIINYYFSNIHFITFLFINLTSILQTRKLITYSECCPEENFKDFHKKLHFFKLIFYPI